MPVRPILPPLLAVGVLLVDPSSAWACGGASPCGCGATLTQSWVQDRNLDCTTGNGLVINGSTGSPANVVLDGNGFSITLRNGGAKSGVLVENHTGAVVRNVRVVKGNGNPTVTGVLLRNTSGATVTGSTLATLDVGVQASLAMGNLNRNLTVTGNTLTGDGRGANLLAVDAGLVLTNNDFTNDFQAVNLERLAGPWSLIGTHGNVFTNVGRSDTDVVIRLNAVSDVTIDGIVAAGPGAPNHYGVGLSLVGVTGVTVTRNVFSGRQFGIQSDQSVSAINTGGTITDNDVTNSDRWGMELRDWDQTLFLDANDFSDSNNGLRLVEIDPDPGETLVVDLETSDFDPLFADTSEQTGVKVVRSHDVEVRHLDVQYRGSGTAILVEDSQDVVLTSLLACAQPDGADLDGVRIGVDLVTGIDGTGADDTVVGLARGDVYVETVPSRAKAKALRANHAVRISPQSVGSDLAVIAAGTGTLLEDTSSPNTTTGFVSMIGAPGWAFQDADLDTCNDLCDPAPPADRWDADTDTYCDDVDLRTAGATTLLSSVPWSTGGVGSPSVIRDTTAGAPYVMVFETQIAAADATCVHGRWALGLATSGNGVTWTPVASALLSPTASTYYSCVAAHPTIVQNGTVTTVWFKAEDETGYTGVGRMLIQWNGTSYSVTAPDPTPVLAETLTFGYMKTVFDATAGRYRHLLARYPDIYATSGTATTMDPIVGPVLSPNDVPWGTDELFNPAVACGRGGEGYTLLLGGRDTTGPPETAVVDDQGLGRLVSSDFSTWTAGPSDALATTRRSEPEFRHWDVLPLGVGGYAVFYDDRSGPGGTNRVRVATTGAAAWNAAAAGTLGTKVCTP